MESLFDRWKGGSPKYDEIFKDSLFISFSQKGGAEGDKKTSLGKHFSNNYELYMYAFFLGLYNDEMIPIPDSSVRIGFSHEIKNWGSKTGVNLRKDFSILQKYIFAALVSKLDIEDLLSLEKGKKAVGSITNQMNKIFESYANGGLTLIKEKSEDQPNFFLDPESFLNMIVQSTESH